MATINLTKAEFLKKIANYEQNTKEWIFLGDKPALIDFYASWCGPCKRLSPILDEFANEYAGKIDIYKIDVDKEEELSNFFGIRTVPTLLFAPIDNKPQMMLGVMTKSELKSKIDSILMNNSI